MTLLHPQKRGLLASDNLLPLFVVISLAFSAINLLLLLSLAVGTFRVASRPETRLVQLVDGRSVLTEPIDHLERSPETIRLFTRNALSMMFTWNAITQVPDAAGVMQTKTDQGVDVGGGRATTKSWQASFAFSEDFRGPFLEAVAEMTPPDIFTGNAQSVFNLTTLSDPMKVDDGEWVVEVVGNLIIFDPQTPRGRAIPFNKEVFLRAVDPPSDPLPEDASPIQQAVYQVRSAGLEITEMNELIKE
ncbi:MAG: hypothetical protein AAF609_01395 [Cyanobacteria bacterium P01_C01_bin.120]